VRSCINSVNRFATVVYKFMYFIFATTAGYIILINEEFFPSALGGSGDARKSFEGFPFQPHTPYLREYVAHDQRAHALGLAETKVAPFCLSLMSIACLVHQVLLD